jgi:hypothetical protein
MLDFTPKKRKRLPPLKCDVCGKFVGYAEIGSGEATHRMATPDSDLSFETFETICARCNEKMTQ